MDLKEAAIYNIANIFKGTGNKNGSQKVGCLLDGTPSIINIPVYQRPYRWAEPSDSSSPKCIKKLFIDYSDNKDTEYFIGSTVFVDRTNHAPKDLKCKEFDVIDGQQRITTLFLINYVRFLILKEIIFVQLGNSIYIDEDLKELNDCFSSLISSKSDYFEELIKEITNITSDIQLGNITAEEAGKMKSSKVVSSVFNGSVYLGSKTDETKEIRLKSNELFLKDENLSLTYSRTSFNTALKTALSSVCICNEGGYTYKFFAPDVEKNSKVSPFVYNYTSAMEQIFELLSSKYDKNKVENSKNSVLQYLKEIARYAKEMLENLSLCVVISSNEKDANKLFEVLNDRSLEVSDLELMKNKFYMQYCNSNTTTEDPNIVDANINELDEIWTKTFDSSVSEQNKLISFLGTVYLTGNEKLMYKSGDKLVDELSNNYFEKYQGNYTAEELRNDFNVYRAVDIILDEADIHYRSKNCLADALKQEQNKSSSYVKKVLCLLVAMGYHSTLPALINPIISFYQNKEKKSLADKDFDDQFLDFINEIFNSEDSNSDHSILQEIAKNLWTAAIRTKDHGLIKDFADLYTKINHKGLDFNSNVDVNSAKSIQKKLDDDFENWLDKWVYSNSKKHLPLKILFYRLLLLKRKRIDEAYKAGRVTFEPNDTGITLKLSVENLQLDHLEPETIDDATKDNYFEPDNREKRDNCVSRLGNFMILDPDKNIKKKNSPIAYAVSSKNGYKKLSDTWLIQDIENMLKDPEFAEIKDENNPTKNIPKEEFFNERTRRLKIYFKNLIKNISDSDDGAFEVDF